VRGDRQPGYWFLFARVHDIAIETFVAVTTTHRGGSQSGARQGDSLLNRQPTLRTRQSIRPGHGQYIWRLHSPNDAPWYSDLDANSDAAVRATVL